MTADTGFGLILQVLPLDTIGADAVELADAVFLAEHAIHAGSGTVSGTVPAGPESTTTLRVGDQARGADEGCASVSLSLTATRLPAEPNDPQDATAPSSGVDDEDGRLAQRVLMGKSGNGARESGAGYPVRVPVAPALPGQARYLSALRSFKRSGPSGPPVAFDEAATVRDSARAGVTVPRRRPRTGPWLNALCVIDGGRSMAVWQATAHEFATTLRISGAFRDVEVLVLDDEAAVAVHAADAPKVVFVVSDGVGGLWERPKNLRAVAGLARGAAVAVFNPLPEHLWRRTALRPIRANVRAFHPAPANGELKFSVYGALAERALAPFESPGRRRPVPLPVFELDAERLSAWADFVRGPADGGLNCALTFAEPDWLLPAPVEAPGAARTARRFLASSPSAGQLAEHLAALGDVMSLEIMRYVQAVLVPESGPTHLAEVLLSGMLTLEIDPMRPPNEWLYRFERSVREELVSRLPFGSQQRVFDLIALGIGRAVSTSKRGFTASATIPSDEGAQGLSHPFTVVGADLAARLRRPEHVAVGGVTDSGDGTDQEAVFDAGARLAAERFRAKGRLEELDEAIGYRTAALAHSTSGRRTGLVRGLVGELTYRWLFSLDPRDLDRAREVSAVQHAALADASRSEEAGGRELVGSGERALSALADSSPDAWSGLELPVHGSRTIAHLLRTRMLPEARYEVARARAGVALAESPRSPAGLAELALARLTLAVALSGPPSGPDPHPVDAAEAISLFRENLMSVTESDLPLANWSGLAARRALALARAAGGPESLDWAVGLLRTTAVRASAVDTDRAELLADLASALHVRYDTRHEPSDLAEAILHLRSVTGRDAASSVRLAGEHRSRCLFELGRAFEERHQLDRRLADLGEAAQSYSDAAKLSEGSQPELNAACLTALGRVLYGQRRQDEAREKLDLGIARFEALGQGAHPSAVAARRLKSEIDDNGH